MILINKILFKIPFIEKITNLETERLVFYEFGIEDNMYTYDQFSVGWRAEPYGTYAK